MFNEDLKLKSEKKLNAYENDKIVLNPPCHSEDIFEIFNSYINTGRSNNHEVYLEKIQNDFPYINEKEILVLLNYFKKLEDYCELVCFTFAEIYQTVPVPTSKNAQIDKQRVINICLTRYPWLKINYIENLLSGVCWLCNR